MRGNVFQSLSVHRSGQQTKLSTDRMFLLAFLSFTVSFFPRKTSKRSDKLDNLNHARHISLRIACFWSIFTALAESGIENSEFVSQGFSSDQQQRTGIGMSLRSSFATSWPRVRLSDKNVSIRLYPYVWKLVAEYLATLGNGFDHGITIHYQH